MHANKAAHLFMIVYTIMDLNQVNRDRCADGEEPIKITPALLCERLGGDEAITPRTIRNHINELERLGVIRRTGGGQGKAYEYDIDFCKLPNEVWTTKADDATMWRLEKHLEWQGLLQRIDGKLYFNFAHPVLQIAMPLFIRFATRVLHTSLKRNQGKPIRLPDGQEVVFDQQGNTVTTDGEPFEVTDALIRYVFSLKPVELENNCTGSLQNFLFCDRTITYADNMTIAHEADHGDSTKYSRRTT